MPLILLDTNVLVYTCDPGEPIKRAQAGAVLRACEQAGNWPPECAVPVGICLGVYPPSKATAHYR